MMSGPDQKITPEECFATVVAALRSHAGVTPPSDIPASKKFGTSAELRMNNKIFAMLSKGKLVVKLPQQRVDALIAAGEGQRYDPGHGRLMKEWLAVEPSSGEKWLPLAAEAMTFVGSKR